MKTWITSDTHFGSQRTLEFSKRPFSSVTEMDRVMIENWNKLVQPIDRVLHLGDFGNIDRRTDLNGHITLLCGNYEDDYEFEVLENVFNKVIPRFKYYTTIGPNSEPYELVHEPSKAKARRFVLYGHIHEKGMIKKNGLNVGVDCHHFKPIDWSTIVFYKEAILKHYDNEVFCSSCGRED